MGRGMMDVPVHLLRCHRVLFPSNGHLQCFRNLQELQILYLDQGTLTADLMQPRMKTADHGIISSLKGLEGNFGTDAADLRGACASKQWSSTEADECHYMGVTYITIESKCMRAPDDCAAGGTVFIGPSITRVHLPCDSFFILKLLFR